MQYVSTPVIEDEDTEVSYLSHLEIVLTDGGHRSGRYLRLQKYLQTTKRILTGKLYYGFGSAVVTCVANLFLEPTFTSK